MARRPCSTRRSVVPSPGSRSKTMWSGGRGQNPPPSPRATGGHGTRRCRGWPPRPAGEIADHGVFDGAAPRRRRHRGLRQPRRARAWGRASRRRAGHRRRSGTASWSADGHAIWAQHHRGDPCVVVEHLPLGEPSGRVEHLVQIGHGELPTVDRRLDRCLRDSRRTSSASLVGPDAPPHRMSEMAVRGPLSEPNLSDQRRADPVRRSSPTGRAARLTKGLDARTWAVSRPSAPPGRRG